MVNRMREHILLVLRWRNAVQNFDYFAPTMRTWEVDVLA